MLMGISAVTSPALQPYRHRRKTAMVPGMARNCRDRLRAVAPVDFENRDTAGQIRLRFFGFPQPRAPRR
jgi:hypothetical protein